MDVLTCVGGGRGPMHVLVSLFEADKASWEGTSSGSSRRQRLTENWRGVSSCAGPGSFIRSPSHLVSSEELIFFHWKLTVCPLVLPILIFPTLLVGPGFSLGFGVEVVGVIANPVRFAFAQRRRKRPDRVFHGLQLSTIVCFVAVDEV